MCRFGLCLFLILYANSLFLIAVILVPSGMVGIRDSYQYFMEGRRWFFEAVLFGLGIDVADTFLKGMDWGRRPLNVGFIGSHIILCIVGVFSSGAGFSKGSPPSHLPCSWPFCPGASPFRGRDRAMRRP